LTRCRILASTTPQRTCHIEATGGTLAKTVSLRANITGSPACGYQLTGVTFAPTAFPQITGPSDAVSKVSSIDLAAVSVAGATANITANQTIAPPDPSVSVSPGSVPGRHRHLAGLQLRRAHSDPHQIALERRAGNRLVSPTDPLL